MTWLWRQKKWVPRVYTTLFGSYYVTVMEWPIRTDPSRVHLTFWGDVIELSTVVNSHHYLPLLAKFPISWGVLAWSQASPSLSTLLVPPCHLTDLRTELDLLHMHWGCKRPIAPPWSTHLLEPGLALHWWSTWGSLPGRLRASLLQCELACCHQTFWLLPAYIWMCLMSASSQPPTFPCLCGSRGDEKWLLKIILSSCLPHLHRIQMESKVIFLLVPLLISFCLLQVTSSSFLTLDSKLN